MGPDLPQQLSEVVGANRLPFLVRVARLALLFLFDGLKDYEEPEPINVKGKGACRPAGYKRDLVGGDFVENLTNQHHEQWGVNRLDTK